jgi:hypothetical protein
MLFIAMLLATQQAALAVVRDGHSTASAPATFSDGAVATAYDHCGESDLCATIRYSNGDLLSIYSEGAAYCQPYMVHFVMRHAATTVYEYTRTLNHDLPGNSGFGSKCGNNQATQMTLDHGLVHLTIDEYTDGTLQFVFSPAK